jgi:hypothetical protein
MNARGNPAKAEAMVEKAVRKAERSANFIRAGWKTGSNKMKSAVKEIAGSPTEDTNVYVRGQNLGRAKPAYNNDADYVEASITNAVQGDGNPNIHRVAEDGAQQAKLKVLADIDVYLERKNREAMQKAGIL